MMTTQFRVLGPIEVVVDGDPIDVGHPRQRGVLGVLLAHANNAVSTDQLLDRVWGERPPQRGRETLYGYLARLRTALRSAVGVADGQARLHRRSGGYQFSVDEHSVDLHQFHHLLAQARDTTDDAQAVALFEEALGLWRGEPLRELDTPWAAGLRATLDQQRLAAELSHVDAALRCGRHTELLPALSDRAQQHPLDERVAGQLMLAMYRSGRPADALERYQRLRTRLADELGIDPGPVLQQLHQQILTTDPDLTLPARTAAAIPQQLPAAPRLFTGRTHELATLTTALDTASAAEGATMVVSALAGAGGIGKTWLALHWAHQNLDRFPDGQLFVDLRGFSPDGQPLSTGATTRGFLDALGVRPAQIPVDPHAQAAHYRDLVAGRRMLIVLDNAHDSDQISPLLPGSPTCTVLVTSRRHLAGLAALHGAHLLDLDILPESDAYDLLAHHLGDDRLAAQPEAVAELLAVCAGLPLAVQIVAARAAHHPTFPLAALAEELRDGSARLDGLDAGELRANLRAVLSWSIRALSQRAARLFGLLGIAPGPDISLPASASLAALPITEARAVLRELEHASLVRQHTPDRYRMHDLIRRYAADTAHHDLAHDEREAALSRIVTFYRHTAHAADRLLAPHRQPILLDPPAPDAHSCPPVDMPAALAWLATERPALLAAQHTAAHHAWPATVWHLAWALDTFLQRRGHRQDRLAVWQAALKATAHLADPTTRALAHGYLGDAYADLGRHQEAIEHLHQALAFAEERDDTLQQARTHGVLARAWELRGDKRLSVQHATRAHEVFRVLDQPVWDAYALNAVGWGAALLGEYDNARSHCQAALALFREHRCSAGEAATLDSLGYVDHHSGHHQQATDHYQQALTLFRAIGDTSEAANSLDQLGHPHVALGEHQRARTVWQEALDLYREQGRDSDADRVQQQLDDLDTRDRARPAAASAGE